MSSAKEKNILSSSPKRGPKKNILIALGSILLLGLAAIVVFFIWKQRSNSTTVKATKAGKGKESKSFPNGGSTSTKSDKDGNSTVSEVPRSVSKAKEQADGTPLTTLGSKPNTQQTLQPPAQVQQVDQSTPQLPPQVKQTQIQLPPQSRVVKTPATPQTTLVREYQEAFDEFGKTLGEINMTMENELSVPVDILPELADNLKESSILESKIMKDIKEARIPSDVEQKALNAERLSLDTKYKQLQAKVEMLPKKGKIQALLAQFEKKKEKLQEIEAHLKQQPKPQSKPSNVEGPLSKADEAKKEIQKLIDQDEAELKLAVEEEAALNEDLKQKREEYAKTQASLVKKYQEIYNEYWKTIEEINLTLENEMSVPDNIFLELYENMKESSMLVEKHMKNIIDRRIPSDIEQEALHLDQLRVYEKFEELQAKIDKLPKGKIQEQLAQYKRKEERLEEIEVSLNNLKNPLDDVELQKKIGDLSFSISKLNGSLKMRKQFISDDA